MSSSPPISALTRPNDAEAPASSPLFRSLGQRSLLPCLLLAAIVFAAYSSVARNTFLNYDDDHYITENPHVKAGLTGSTMKWAFTTFDEANWHPLTWLSHALDCQLFGLNPAGPHLVNVLLHAINAILLFLLLQSATGYRWRSLMVAALFALHPLNVESVAWAAERKNVLSMMFFLLALLAYDRYARHPNLRLYAVVASLFSCALLSKPQVITFPFLLLLWDYWPLRRVAASNQSQAVPIETASQSSIGWLVLEKLPLLALSTLSAVVTIKAQRAGGAVQSLSLYSLPLRIETALMSYTAYIGKMFWPVNLAALYPHPTQLFPAWQLAAALLLLLLITAYALRHRSDRPYLVVGWLWFLGSMVPMIGLVQVGAQGMADRYMYLPMMGLLLMVTGLAADRVPAPSARWLALPAAASLLLVGALTFRQVNYWRDIPTFWTHTLAVTQKNYVAHDTFGDYLASQGQSEEAAAQFRAALAIRPDDLPAELNLGIYEHGRGNLTAAIARYKVVALNSSDLGMRATVYGNLGSAYRQMGDFAKARQCYQTALQWMPDRTMAMIGLGLIAQKTGDADQAVQQYSRAMQVEPTDVGFLLLAGALRQQGNAEQASAIEARVARFSPNLANARAAADALLAGK